MLYLYSLNAAGWLYLYLSWCYMVSLPVSEVGHIPSWAPRLLLHAAQAPFLAAFCTLVFIGNTLLTGLVGYQTRLIALNETTNEVSNAHRLEYLLTPDGRYRNPFNSGPTRNCVDFFWQRRSYAAVWDVGCASGAKTGCPCPGNHAV